jgi:hypothetical protein
VLQSGRPERCSGSSLWSIHVQIKYTGPRSGGPWGPGTGQPIIRLLCCWSRYRRGDLFCRGRARNSLNERGTNARCR